MGYEENSYLSNVCPASSPNADPVHRISIIPRGIAALGYTLQLPTEDGYLVTRAELLDKLAVLFGGREEVARITHETYARVREVLTKRRDDLERVARRLLETEVLEGEELQRLLYGASASPQPNPIATATV